MSFAPLILFIVEMNLYPKSQDMQKIWAAWGAVIQNWHKEHLLELFERRQIALQRPSPVLAPVLWQDFNILSEQSKYRQNAKLGPIFLFPLKYSKVKDSWIYGKDIQIWNSASGILAVEI